MLNLKDSLITLIVKKWEKAFQSLRTLWRTYMFFSQVLITHFLTNGCHFSEFESTANKMASKTWVCYTLFGGWKSHYYDNMSRQKWSGNQVQNLLSMPFSSAQTQMCSISLFFLLRVLFDIYISLAFTVLTWKWVGSASVFHPLPPILFMLSVFIYEFVSFRTVL